MSPPSQYSSVPKVAIIIIFTTTDSFTCFWGKGITQCIFAVKTCLCSFGYSQSQTKTPKSKLLTIKTWDKTVSPVCYASFMSLFHDPPNSYSQEVVYTWCLRRPILKGWTSPWPSVFKHCSVTGSGSNKLCLPLLSPFILYTLTATIFHSSGRAAGHGGCCWGTWWEEKD